mmetsp:Transcript_9098/g.26542  ORF Transcript_9098/g.26542 Transcript_9098/m.26542 type:complete len:298 (-) Transcript_9098:124-1017(-)
MEPGDDGFRIEYLYWRHADPKVPRGGVALGERFDGAFSRFRAAPEPPDPGAVIPAPASPVWTQHRKKFKSDEVMAVGSEDDAKVEEPAAMQAVMGEAAVVTTVEPTGASGDDGSASPLPVLPASAESARALDARIDLEDTGINLGTQRPDLEPLVEPKHYDGLPTGLGPVSSSAEEDAARAVDERILYHDTGLEATPGEAEVEQGGDGRPGSKYARSDLHVREAMHELAVKVQNLKDDVKPSAPPDDEGEEEKEVHMSCPSSTGATTRTRWPPTAAPAWFATRPSSFPCASGSCATS